MQAVVKNIMYRCAVVTALGLGSVSAQADEIRTTTGKTYRSAKVVQIDPNGIIVRHSKGTAKVLFQDLNKSAQKQYGYNKDAAELFESTKADVANGPSPAPAPEGEGGFVEPAAKTITYGPILNSVMSVRYGNTHYPWHPCHPYGIDWRRHSVDNLLWAPYRNHPAPWQFGGYHYPYFKRR